MIALDVFTKRNIQNDFAATKKSLINITRKIDKKSENILESKITKDKSKRRDSLWIFIKSC